MWPRELRLLAALDKMLAECEVCVVCRLRIIGVKSTRDYNAYINKERQEMLQEKSRINDGENGNDIKEEDQSNSKSNGNGDSEPCRKRVRLVSSQFDLCRLCLGLLQPHFMRDALLKLCPEFESCPFDAKTFTVALSLPSSMSLRSHSFKLHLEHQLKQVEKDFDWRDVVPLKQTWKWIFANDVQKLLGKKFCGGEEADFFVEIVGDFQRDQQELEALKEMCKEEYLDRERRLKTFHMGLVTRQGLDKSLATVDSEMFAKCYAVPPTKIDEKDVKIGLKMYHNSVFVAGRYNKYTRQLPQTPWLVDGVRRMESSVEELITAGLAASTSKVFFDESRFASSGREDVDVRMLGRGRPFFVELINPRIAHIHSEQLRRAEQVIKSSSNGAVIVTHLQMAQKSDLKALKEGEDAKRKWYTALCISNNASVDPKSFQRKIDAFGAIKLKQKTPIRVLHRRPNAVRERDVTHLRVEEVKNQAHLFKLHMSTQAGTYVKEFVHGDLGRTRPCLRSILGEEVDIVALDVKEIDLDWPPPVINEDSVTEKVENG